MYITYNSNRSSKKLRQSTIPRTTAADITAKQRQNYFASNSSTTATMEMLATVNYLYLKQQQQNSRDYSKTAPASSNYTSKNINSIGCSKQLT